MSHVDTFGWFSMHLLNHLCQDCQWVCTERHMVSCEYGEPVFPAAHRCPHFKQEDDEA